MSAAFQAARDAQTLVVFLPTITRENAGDFRTLLGGLVTAGFTDIVLDCSEMTHLDSLGLAEIVRSYTFCQRSSVALSLNRPLKAMRELLEVTRLVTIFTIFDVDYGHLARMAVSPDDIGALGPANPAGS